MTQLTCSFVLNGRTEEVSISPNTTLLHMLRESFMLTGVREGCGHGECGSCSISVNGKLVNSCLILAAEIDGAEIQTVEGVATEDGSLHPVQQAFVDESGMQCGACTSGMIMSVKSLLDANPDPTRDEMKEALAGNFCRCTGWELIFKSVEEAAKAMRQGAAR